MNIEDTNLIFHYRTINRISNYLEIQGTRNEKLFTSKNKLIIVSTCTSDKFIILSGCQL